jgi:hypothetical protein
MMIHAAIHWPEVDDESLWPLAVSHAAYLYNHIPNSESGISPVEIFTGTLSDHQSLRLAHTWGCPVYVLEPRLTSAGGKIPKWQPRSRRAQYMGVSPVHAENVGVVRNLRTGYLSPQYHLVFDDWFETVYSDDSTVPDAWESLCIFDRFELAFEEGSTPPLAAEWFTPEELEHTTPVIPRRKELYHNLHDPKSVRSPALPQVAPRELNPLAPRETHDPSPSPLVLRKDPILSRKEMPSPGPFPKPPPIAPPPRRRNPDRTAKHKGITDRLS